MNHNRLLISTDQAESQLWAILQASEDGIILKSLDNTILGWSRGAERIYGYTAEEVIGKPITILYPPDRTAEADQILEKIKAGKFLEKFETVRVTNRGKAVDVSLTVTPVRDRKGKITGTITFVRDTGERRVTEQAIQVLREQEESRSLLLQTARRVALDILVSQTGQEALYHIADAARTLAGARYAALGVARPDGQGLMQFVTVGLNEGEEALLGARPRGVGVLGVLLHRTEPLRIDDLTTHPASVGFPPHHPPMKSFLGVPIRRADRVVGSLYLTDKLGGGSFTEADEEAVEALGAHAAVAVHNLHMLAQKRALVSGLINAQEEERRAVAYDLHDGLTQYVMASHAHLEAFRHSSAVGKTERAQEELELALGFLKDAVVESRRLVNGLRSLALDDLGLPGAIEQILEEERVRAGWEKADLVQNIEGRRFGKSLETAVYRVVQEAITNARKHANASEVSVKLRFEAGPSPADSRLDLEVRDWGCGFDPNATARDDDHVGLQGMAERASLMGGAFEIKSYAGAGTFVTATFPAIEIVEDGETG